MTFKRASLAALLCATAAPIALALPTQAIAQRATYRFDIPEQDLGRALAKFGKVTRAQLVFDSTAMRKARSRAVNGVYTAPQALDMLLNGTGFREHVSPAGVFVIEADEPQPEPAATARNTEPAPEDIVVTGSHLNANFDGTIPVAEVNRDDLLEDGYTDIADALDDIPGVDVSDSLSNGQSSIQGNGLSTISLRGLGSNRTLTLIDGHRTVSNKGNGNVVSLSSIPEYFVDRVDVSTGGASAVYGSDAIAGVVNVVTSRFDGLRARVVGGATWGGGGDHVEYSAGWGKHIGDKLYVMGGVTYEQQFRLKATDRRFAIDSVSYDFADNTLTRPDLSSNIPGGRFNSNDFYYDATGLHEDFVKDVNGYEDRLSETIITPRKTLDAAGKLEYAFSDNVKFTASYLYSKVVTNSVAEPDSVSYSTSYGANDEFEVGRINRDNPFVPEEIYDDSSKSGVKFYRRMTEVGARHRYNRRVTNRAWAGLEGKIFDGAWDWHLTYGFGKFSQYQDRSNYLNLENLHYAVNAERDGSGAIVCADATARAAGCVPIDLFGIGAVSPEAADYIREDSKFYAHNRQDTVEGYMTGPLFTLPAGPVQAAVGFEWRRDKTSSLTDPVTQTGVSSASYIPDFTGKIEAKEAYVELGVPVLRDVPFAYRLSLDGAVRVADYDIPAVGTTVSFKGGAQWAPVKGLSFRGAFSRAQRAPDTTELFSPPRDDYDDVIDVCRGVSASSTGTIAQNCLADARIAAAAAASPDGKFQQISGEVFAPNSGNPNLHEETANTLTVGVVAQPRFLRHFQFSADYYDIRVKDAISSLDNSELLLECYSDPDGADNRFCGTITRGSDGQLVKILNQDENLNELRAQGIDVAAAWRIGLDGIGLPGHINLSARYTHRLKLQTKFDGNSGVEVDDYVGEVGVSKDEAKLSAGWSGKALSIKWSAVYLGPTVDSHQMEAYFKDNGITDPMFLNVPAYWRHDISFKILPWPHKPDLRFFGTIRNVFNNHGPFLPDGTDSGSSLNYSSVFDVRGRTITLGLETRF